MIKFTKITFFALLTLFMAACGGDEDIMVSVEGEWHATEVRTDNGKSTTTDQTGESYIFNYTMVGEDLNLTVNFNEDNTFTSSGNYIGKLSGTIDGQPIEQSVPINDFAAEGTWTLDGDLMTTTSPSNDNIPQTATILTLTDSVMEIEYNLNRTEIQNGFAVKIEGAVFYRLEK